MGAFVLYKNRGREFESLPQKIINQFKEEKMDEINKYENQKKTLLSICEYCNFEYNEDLPYDISKDEILLEEDDYPVWYMDVFDNFEKYYGKTIRFKTFVRDILDETFVIGRNVMTCCEDDIQFLGYEVINETDMLVGIGDVIFLECNVVHEYSEFAKEEVVMLKAKKIFKLPYEKDKVLSF